MTAPSDPISPGSVPATASAGSPSAPASSPAGHGHPSPSGASLHPEGELPPPLGLTASDFDACADASDTSLLRRRAVLERMREWSREVVQRLSEAELPVELESLDGAELVHELPRISFRRAPEEGVRRAPTAPGHREHAWFGLLLTARGVEARLALSSKNEDDIRNIRMRLSDPERALELLTTFEALPEQFSFAPAGANPWPLDVAYRTTADQLHRVLDTLEQTGLTRDSAESLANRSVHLSWFVSRDIVESNGALFEELLGDAMVALGSVFRLVAWGPQEEAVPADEEEELPAGRARPADGDRPRRPRETEGQRQARRAPALKGPRPTRRPPRDEPWKPHEEDAGDLTADPGLTEEAAPVSRAGAARLNRPIPWGGAGMPRRAFLRSRALHEVDPNAPIEKGTKVQVLEGPFAGKVGVVNELDGRGTARVMLGLLAMWIPVVDLIAATDGRGGPVLGSSHRKPAPAR